jgi:uncharacterized protein YcgI (DUF1989 family)
MNKRYSQTSITTIAVLMEQVFETVMAPATGLVQVVKTGQRFRVNDLEGLQVVDVPVFNANNVREKLSTFYSRSRAGVAGEDGFHPRDRLFEGDLMMSTIKNEMMRMTVDTPEVKGMHDVHGCMCDRYLYRALGQG